LADYNKFQQFPEDLAHGVHNLGADTLMVALTNSAPTADMETFSEITEIDAGNGYSAGGTQASLSGSAQTSGTYKLVLGDVVFTAASGSMDTARYAVLYNTTPTSPADPLIAWWDYGSSITLAVGETLTWDADASTGVLTIA
jgi:hypothetical protein